MTSQRAHELLRELPCSSAQRREINAYLDDQRDQDERERDERERERWEEEDDGPVEDDRRHKCECPFCHCYVRTDRRICDMCASGAHQG